MPIFSIASIASASSFFPGVAYRPILPLAPIMTISMVS